MDGRPNAQILDLSIHDGICPGCGGLDGDHDKDCDYEDEE